MTYTHLWIALAIIFAVIEAFTLGLTTIWFAGAALIAMLAAAIGLSLTWQIFIFLIASAVLIYFTRPFFTQKLKVGAEKTNVDSLIGEMGIVIEDINPYETGLVKVLGQVWTAKSVDDQFIPYNSRVTIIKIEGVKIIVEAVAD